MEKRIDGGLGEEGNDTGWGGNKQASVVLLSVDCAPFS